MIAPAIIRNLFFIFLISLFSFSCEILSKKDKDKNNTIKYLEIIFGLTFNNGENAAKLFLINPLIKSGSNLNLDFVGEANASNVTVGKKKIIFVHGWDFNDNDLKVFSIGEQKGRIVTDAWADVINSSVFDSIVITKNYEVYGFDYLTSHAIDLNGTRFRARMDALFGADTSTVVIVAHSMGGLISRFAAYEGTRPAYLNRIITLGTPFHGSPWASPQFQSDKGTIGSIAGFVTNTTGGQELAWDNFDGSITGASNPKLTAINAKTDRDDLFYPYYGSVPSSGAGGSGATLPGLYAACPFLGGAYAPSDCIVPSTSAGLTGNTLAVPPIDVGAYDHVDIKVKGTAHGTFLTNLP